MDQNDHRLSERMIAIVRRLLGPTAVIPDPFPVDRQLADLGISSINMVNLMLAIEMEFDFTIPPADITPENFHSLASVEALVQRTLERVGVRT